MKTKFFALLLWLPAFAFCLSARAQGTAFTYQGHLNASGSPANGTFDLRFSLFDVSGGGSAVAGPVTNSATSVSNGLFTVLVDFGTGAFTGANRWLEIGVRSTGGGAFATLAPRQPITPAPYAIFAANSAAGGSGPWLLNGSNTFYNAGNVGIGTNSPGTALHIKGTAEGIRIDGPAAGAANSAFLSFRDVNGNRIGYVGDGSSFDTSVALSSDTGDVVLNNASGRILVAQADGTVTVGPTHLLVPGGEENLRIVRGVVSGAGTIIVGSGFTVTHTTPGSGQYTVTFNTQFFDSPTVVATADLDGRLISTVGASLTSVNFQTRDVISGVTTDAAFHFIAIGPR
jgi:hypothetical protein